MGKVLEDVSIEIHMPKAVLVCSCNLSLHFRCFVNLSFKNCTLVQSQGKYSFDTSSKLLQWTVGKIELGKPPTLKGSINLSPGAGQEIESPAIAARFRINQLAISGLKVSRLDVHGESYKPFKVSEFHTSNIFIPTLNNSFRVSNMSLVLENSKCVLFNELGNGKSEITVIFSKDQTFFMLLSIRFRSPSL